MISSPAPATILSSPVPVLIIRSSSASASECSILSFSILSFASVPDTIVTV